jgi:RNA polymerase sigma-70 factor (ECF subfamily)
VLTLDPEGNLISVTVLDVAGGQIQAVNTVANPEKLGHLGPVGDLRALLGGAKEQRPDTPR